MKDKKRLSIYVGIIAVIILIGILIGIFVFQKMRRNYKIEEVTEFNYYAMVKDGKTGVIDTKGNILVEPTYESVKIPNPSKPVFICIYDYNSDNGNYKTKVLNEKGEEILTPYQDVTPIQLQEIVSTIPYEKSILKFKKDNKYGLIDFNGKVIVQAIYEEISNISYKEGELLVKKDGKYGVINMKGVTLVDIHYDSIQGDNYYSEKEGYKIGGYIVSNRTNEGIRYGYVSEKGKLILKVEYNKLIRVIEIQEDKNIYLLAEKNGRAGVTQNGKVKIEYTYDDIEYEEINQLFIVKKDNKQGVISKEGTVILPIEYNTVYIEGLYIYADKENRNLVFDKNGKAIEQPKYQNIIATSNQDYHITIDGEGMYGVENAEGKVLIPNKYYYVEYLYKNYFIVVGEEGKSGIVNANNETILPIAYDVVQKIENTELIQTLISETGVLSLCDTNIKPIVEMKKAKLSINKEYIKLYSNEDTKYFGLDGKEKNNRDVFTNNTLFAKKENGKWGYVDKQGNKKIEYQYEKVTEFNRYGYAGIKKDGKWGVIGQDEVVVVEPTYTIQEMAGEPDFIGKYYKVVSGYGEIYYTDDKKE